MTRRVDLPTTEEIARRVEELTTSNGRPPAVIALARDLQLSNATFWRHFPSIAQSVADAGRAFRQTGHMDPPLNPASNTKSSPGEQPPTSPRLAGLQTDLQAAAREIQRLTLENETLRAQLQDVTSVLPIRPRDV